MGHHENALMGNERQQNERAIQDHGPEQGGLLCHDPSDRARSEQCMGEAGNGAVAQMLRARVPCNLATSHPQMRTQNELQSTCAG